MITRGSRINGGGPLLGRFNDLLGPTLKKYHALSLEMELLHHCADFGTNMIYHGGSMIAIKHEIL